MYWSSRARWIIVQHRRYCADTVVPFYSLTNLPSILLICFLLYLLIEGVRTNLTAQGGCPLKQREGGGLRATHTGHRTYTAALWGGEPGNTFNKHFYCLGRFQVLRQFKYNIFCAKEKRTFQTIFCDGTGFWYLLSSSLLQFNRRAGYWSGSGTHGAQVGRGATTLRLTSWSRPGLYYLLTLQVAPSKRSVTRSQYTAA